MYKRTRGEVGTARYKRVRVQVGTVGVFSHSVQGVKTDFSVPSPLVRTAGVFSHSNKGIKPDFLVPWPFQLHPVYLHDIVNICRIGWEDST
jgi:hypothetical protein